jgi:hypothetical protein
MYGSIPQSKQCPNCKSTKPTSDFATDKRAATGCQSWCKTCVSDYIKSKRQHINTTARERKRRLALNGKCPICGKELTEKYRHCIDCLTTMRNQSRQSRAKRIQAYSNAGLCTRCGKSKPLPALINAVLSMRLCETCYLKRTSRNRLGTEKHWEYLKNQLENQRHLCAYSGDVITLGLNDSLDHIQPVYHFPHLKDDPTNVVWTTREVNEMKRDRTPEQFLALIQRICQYMSRQA